MEKAPEGLEVIRRFFADFTPRQLGQLAALNGLYHEWNEKINVISRKDIDSLYEKHVLHSLAIAAAFTLAPGMDVIDIGTGGGFPGIPLAIFFPDTRFHLVDSIGKKLKVVDAVSEAIGLTNVTTRHIRAEEIKDRKFDLAVSRAVAPLKDLWAWSRPLLRKPPPPSNRQSPSQPDRQRPSVPDQQHPFQPDQQHPSVPDQQHASPQDQQHPSVPDQQHASPQDQQHPFQPDQQHPSSLDQEHPFQPDRQRPSPLEQQPQIEPDLPRPSGLICLKGGDLAAEISASGTRPRIMEVYELFPLEEFREKYLLQIPY
jgi:16S rRNA (guanine527-N7)-methyltransferase